MPKGNYRYIHPEQKRLVCTMSGTMTKSEISAATGISERAIRRMLRRWHDTGSVIAKPGPVHVGRPRLLTSLDLAVSAL